MTIEELKKKIPGIANALGKMLANDAMEAIEAAGITLDDADPSVSITLRPKTGGPDIRLTLTLEQVSDDGDDD